MATLDFREVGGEPSGENFQALVRLLGERFGLIVEWAGRGPDGGKDLIFIEIQQGLLKSTPIRWLVSCKDNSDSNKSVTEKDVGSILDKVHQHQCKGFLLATTTTVSSGLKELLDKLDFAGGGSIQTKVWDRFEITKLLLSDKCDDLLLQFFPKQKARESVSRVTAAREVIEASVPRFVCGKVRQCLVSYSERQANIVGNVVWPHDMEQASIIDDLAKQAVSRSGIAVAARKVQELHFDAFVAFIDRLIRNFPDQAERILLKVGQESLDEAIIHNVVEILRETDEFSLDQELEITKRCNSESLFELYSDITKDALQDVDVWDWRLPAEVQMHDDKIEVESAEISDLEFWGGDSVNLRATLTLRVLGYSLDPEKAPAGRAAFAFDIEGYWLCDGVEIDAIK